MAVDAQLPQYVAALNRYLRTADETHRAAAYDIGRAFISDGGSLLELNEAHTSALVEIFQEQEDDRCADLATKASEFLAEGLSPFEMALRGFRDANELLRELNDTLERRIEERTKERLELEEQVRAARRMEAIGRLAGGIAHDFNNILTIIQSYAVFLEGEFPEGHEGREMVEIIADASERAAGLTHQLLAFSRSQAQALEVIDINAALNDLHRLLIRVIGEDIELETSLQKGLDTVLADITQIEQVVLNLVVNARDAMPDGGKLTIETRNVTLDESYAARDFEGVPPGDYVMIAVSDDGEGMDEETRKRLFEPFFTTKESGKGTGLGLATVYGIVRQHNGYIWVYSEPGEGATFKVYLPSTATQPRERTKSETTDRQPRGEAGATVLLVEDQDVVRRAAARLLRRDGHTVIECSNPRTALDIARNSEDRIDVLVTDMVMPDMNGRALAAALRESRPGLPVVIMSGYTDHAVMQRGLVDNGVIFVQKPFTPDTLSGAIERALQVDRE